MPPRSELLDRPTHAHRLGSGHRLVVRSDDEGELVAIENARGDAVVTITLTPEGPRIEARGAYLALSAADEIELSCDRLRLAARSGVAIETAGEATIQARSVAAHATDGDVDLRGRFVRLNSPDDAPKGA